MFERACSQCHGGPGQSTPVFPVNRFSTISSQCPRPVDTATPARFAFAECPPRLARNARTYEIVLSLPTQGPAGIIPAGTRVRRTSSDPGRALQTGFVGGPGPFDDWDKFDVPGLRGLRATAPYFHNNSAGTLEEVVDHYEQFFKRIEALTAPGAAASPAASIAHRDPKSAPRSWPTCASCERTETDDSTCERRPVVPRRAEHVLCVDGRRLRHRRVRGLHTHVLAATAGGHVRGFAARALARAAVLGMDNLFPAADDPGRARPDRPSSRVGPARGLARDRHGPGGLCRRK